MLFSYSIYRFQPPKLHYLLPIIYYQFEGPAYICINVHFSFVFSNYVVSTTLLVMITKNIHQGPVVQSWVSANPVLKFNPLF